MSARAIALGDAPGETLDLAELLATRLLVQGNSGSGKSHLLRRLLEQSAALVQQVVIDPEGDFVSLADAFGHLVIDAADYAESALMAAALRAREHRASVVLNLEHLDAEGQMRAAAHFLDGLFDAPRAHWYPVLVALDEAQLFAPSGAVEVSEDARRRSLSATTNLMCRGRKRGLCGIIATQRLAKLAKNVAAEASNFLMGRTFLDIDMQRAADLLGMERRQAEAFRDLERGAFLALGPALCRRPRTIRVGATRTVSRGAGPQLLPPVEHASPEDLRQLILSDVAEEVIARAPRPPRASAPAPDLLAQLAAHRPEPAPDTTAPDDRETRLVRARALLRDMLAEEGDAPRTPALLHQDFLLRARIEGFGRQALDWPDFAQCLAIARAGVEETERDDPVWIEIEARAAALEEDVRGVYLLLARAARQGAPCPDDGALARAYGTASQRRARRQLDHLEARDVIVLRDDGRSPREVTIIGPGWRTG